MKPAPPVIVVQPPMDNTQYGSYLPPKKHFKWVTIDETVATYVES